MKPHRSLRSRGVLSVSTLLLPVLGCAGSGDQRTIPETREVANPPPAIGREVTDVERFEAHAAVAAGGEHTAALEYELPDGWSEREATPLRAVNLTVRARPEVECYVTILPGGGGILANVNRWRGQFGLEPIGEAELEALPPVTLLGQVGKLVELSGAYAGMGSDPRPDFSMLGAIVERGVGGMAFVKMTGPRPDVLAEREAFLAFVRSLGIGTGAAPRPKSARDLVFRAPDGWVRGADRPMRLVTFNPGGDAGIECYASVLNGDGGGMLPNLNRWRAQFGLGALSPDQASDLPSVRVLGVDCPLLEIQGSYTDMSGHSREGYGLLATICALDGETLFLKLVGPADRVAAEREAFRKFCETIGF